MRLRQSDTKNANVGKGQQLGWTVTKKVLVGWKKKLKITSDVARGVSGDGRVVNV